jgi:hypothetical protein
VEKSILAQLAKYKKIDEKVVKTIEAALKIKPLPFDINMKIPVNIEAYNVAFVQKGNQGENKSHAVVKEFKSNIDFTHLAVGPGFNPQEIAIHENVAHIPAVPTGPGKEEQIKNYDGAGVFTLDTLKYGVEICLDHLVGRLKKSGAKVHVQLVPSAGMKLGVGGIVAQPDGYAFNVDGLNTSAGIKGNACHTQLWKIKKGGYEEIAKCGQYPVAGGAGLLAKGGGEVHVYEPLAYPAFKV